MFFIAVWVKAGLPDPRGDALQKDIQDLGITTVTHARVRDIYLLEGRLSEAEVGRICQELLADPVVQEYSYGEAPTSPGQQAHVIEVAYNPGVMDPVEESIIKGIRDLGISTVDRVKTAKRYFLWGELSKQELATICDKLLVNPVIQHVVTSREELSLPPATYDFSLESIELLGLDDAALTELSKNRLWLNLSEMKRIQSYFSGSGRNPTDIELETLAQTWSEHCVHKTFNGKIKLGQLVIDNLLKSTIMRVTDELK